MVFVAFVVGFWVDVGGIGVGVMYGYADFINEVSCWGCGMRKVVRRVRMLCSSSVMEISGGGSVSLSCSSSLESRTKGGGGRVLRQCMGFHWG
jgi:hypothetical protein